MKHLEKLSLQAGVSGDETAIRRVMYQELNEKVDQCYFDGLGSFISKKGTGATKVALVSHMDEVGFMVKYIDAKGFIYFEAIGSWFNQMMLNHKVEIKDFNGNKHIGIIGSVAPHSLTPEMKKKPMEIDNMFIDCGYNSKEQVIAAGIAVGNFITPHSEYTEFGNNKIMVKALDNRVGVSLVIDAMEQITNDAIELYGVGTVQEEVGLRGAQASASTIKPDLAIAIDVIIAGDTPLMNEIKYPVELGAGPAMSLFDMRAIPNQKLQRKVEQIARDNKIPYQVYTMKTGATDAGRYNVMEGGCPVLTISIPTRYIHGNHSVMDKTDYIASFNLIEKIIKDVNIEFMSEINNFLD